MLGPPGCQTLVLVLQHMLATVLATLAWEGATYVAVHMVGYQVRNDRFGSTEEVIDWRCQSLLYRSTVFTFARERGECHD